MSLSRIFLIPVCCFKNNLGTSLAVQWLRLWTSKARGSGSIPSQGTKEHMPQGQKRKKKKKERK